MAVFSRYLFYFSTSIFLIFFSTNATTNGFAGDLPPTIPPPPSGGVQSPFNPSVAVVACVLTITFSITFLLLLYSKHCKRVTVTYYDDSSTSHGGTAFSSSVHKTSGIDRSVIDSLPIFRFSSLIGQTEGLDCAVCLTRFEPSVVLRLLPKCKHAFHVECVDTWLDAHSTCPLCRYRVDPEDILEDRAKMFQPNPTASDYVSGQRSKRVLGRHSSAGESGSLGLQKPGKRETGLDDPASFRRSVDSLWQKRRSESVAVGCFDRGRKDGILLNYDGTGNDRSRFEHRIVVSGRSSRSTASGVQ